MDNPKSIETQSISSSARAALCIEKNYIIAEVEYRDGEGEDEDSTEVTPPPPLLLLLIHVYTVFIM